LGMATGAAIASSNTAAATTSAYSSGYAAGSANTANTTSAYNAGVATGAALATGAAAGAKVNYVMGVNYGILPADAKMINTNGINYYVSGSTWFQPAFGPNGVYYRVVPVP
ncbi:MAG: hypothetical protein IT514_09625, partial [Burkholderiales bacterium]|nr:hypothetical protein [Burkholderiales bacterium]